MEMSMNVVIVAVLALLILAILVYFIYGTFNDTENSTQCVRARGVCKEQCNPGVQPIGESEWCGPNQDCCPIIGG